jgi:hypothetical protein
MKKFTVIMGGASDTCFSRLRQRSFSKVSVLAPFISQILASRARSDRQIEDC